MTYDRATIFRRAWPAAKARREYHHAEDWTPGLAMSVRGLSPGRRFAA